MAIRWDKFTVKAQEAVQRASELASEHGNPEVLPVHLLAALLEDKEGIVPPVLEKIGTGPQLALNEIYQEMGRLPKVSGGGELDSEWYAIKTSAQLRSHAQICFHQRISSRGRPLPQ